VHASLVELGFVLGAALCIRVVLWGRLSALVKKLPERERFAVVSVLGLVVAWMLLATVLVFEIGVNKRAGGIAILGAGAFTAWYVHWILSERTRM